ncbi:MAG: hypothetical protein AB7F89_09860 [Pirellulaceae bacterium]
MPGGQPWRIGSWPSQRGFAALADANNDEFFGHSTLAEKERLVSLLQDIVRRQVGKDRPVN